jgi:preprotein translocase subunit SecD
LDLGGGIEWIVDFELDAEGRREFDEAASTLFNQVPRGMIAIVLDGEIHSYPIVQSPSFKGSGRISGNWKGAEGEREARTLATALRTGGLPVPLRLESERRR